MVHDSTYIDRWHTQYEKGDTVFVTNEQITVSLKNSEPATITLFNALGQEVRKVHATTQETVIPVSDLNAGVYLIRVEQKGMQHQGKFVIQ